MWVSLSEKSFKRYIEAGDELDETDEYFGWFCNRLPYYEDTMSLKTNVYPRRQGKRPYIILERSDHLLAEHQREGISVQQAQEIAECAMHANDDK